MSEDKFILKDENGKPLEIFPSKLLSNGIYEVWCDSTSEGWIIEDKSDLDLGTYTSGKDIEEGKKDEIT